MPLLDTLSYDSLFSSDFDVVTEPVLITAGQVIARGDLLVKLVTESIVVTGTAGAVTRAVAASYVKVTAEADEHSFYAIAAEDLASNASAETISGYKTGMFNSNAVDFGGATAIGSKDVLAANGIYFNAATLA